MNSVQNMMPVPTLNLAPGIVEGDMNVLLPVQSVTFLVKENISGHEQRPKTQDGGGVHELVLVETKQIFSVTITSAN